MPERREHRVAKAKGVEESKMDLTTSSQRGPCSLVATYKPWYGFLLYNRLYYCCLHLDQVQSAFGFAQQPFGTHAAVTHRLTWDFTHTRCIIGAVDPFIVGLFQIIASAQPKGNEIQVTIENLRGLLVFGTYMTGSPPVLNLPPPTSTCGDSVGIWIFQHP